MPLRCLRITSLICAVALAAPATGAAATHRAHKRPKITIRHAVKSSKKAKRKAKAKVTHVAAPAPLPQPRTVPAVCPNAQASAAATSAPVLRAAVVCLANQQRVNRGLPPMVENAVLDGTAQLWTNTLVAPHIFTHGNFTQRLDSAGYDWSNAGENIATGYDTPAAVVAAWMASPEHCQNVLNPNYADIGVGVNPSLVDPSLGDGATWTQDFGLTMLAPYPSHNTGPMSGCPYQV